MPAPIPLVGVGVLIVRDGRVLLGLRHGSHGADTWAPPGGHLEFGESVEDCARRETREEKGLELGLIRAGPYTSDVFAEEEKHYVTLFVTADAGEGEPEVREPAKCRRWEWFPWSALPEPLFLPIASLRRQGYPLNSTKDS
jgi:8-oxo-dGTP diphosphatase